MAKCSTLRQVSDGPAPLLAIMTLWCFCDRRELETIYYSYMSMATHIINDTLIESAKSQGISRKTQDSNKFRESDFDSEIIKHDVYFKLLGFSS